MHSKKLVLNKSKVDSDFIKVYEPLLKKFIEEIKDIEKENLPEPFIPVYGKNYESTPFKIAFVGWETRNNSSLKKFYDVAEKSPLEALNRFYEVIDLEEEENLTNYGSKFGNGFWNFVFKFLAKLYNKDWKEIKRKSHPEILKSFVWGNLDSIERFEVSAKGAGGNYQEWEKVKRASTIFDNAEVFIKALKPKVIIVLQWQEDDLWINGIKNIEHEIILVDYLEYYHLKDSDTHIYWTRHPRGLSNYQIEEYILRIFISINDKNIFPDYPGKKFFDSIEILNLQLKELGDEFGLLFEDLPYWGTNSGFYFTSSRWKDYLIGFEFEGNWGSSFFGGIRKIDNNSPRITDKSIGQKLGMTEEAAPYWPYWFWFEENYSNWDKKLIGELKNGNFLAVIKKHVERMLPALNELEKEWTLPD
jgi:hypothetical protein